MGVCDRVLTYFCAGSLFCGEVPGVYSSFAIIMPRTRELVA